MLKYYQPEEITGGNGREKLRAFISHHAHCTPAAH